MRNTPLPFMSPVNSTDSEQLTKDLAKGFQDKKRQELTETFKSARTKKEERKDQFKKDKKAEREDIRTARKALKNLKDKDSPDYKGKDEDIRKYKDRKKAERKSLQNVRIQERKKRAEDRKQQWAEKRFLQGKYDSVDQAKKRFESMQNITTKQTQNYDGIMDGIGGRSNDPETEASEATYDANTLPITDASMDTDDYTKGFGSGIYDG